LKPMASTTDASPYEDAVGKVGPGIVLRISRSVSHCGDKEMAASGHLAPSAPRQVFGANLPQDQRLRQPCAISGTLLVAQTPPSPYGAVN
jgi:hypothetical protein